MSDYKTIAEISEALNKALKELLEEIAKALRFEKICNFLNRILKGGK